MAAWGSRYWRWRSMKSSSRKVRSDEVAAVEVVDVKHVVKHTGPCLRLGTGPNDVC